MESGSIPRSLSVMNLFDDDEDVVGMMVMVEGSEVDFECVDQQKHDDDEILQRRKRQEEVEKDNGERRSILLMFFKKYFPLILNYLLFYFKKRLKNTVCTNSFFDGSEKF